MNNFLASKFKQFSVPFSNIISNKTENSDNDETKLEYDQNDNLVSEEESIKRIFWMFYLFSILMAFVLTFLIAFVLWLATLGPTILLPGEITENIYHPYLHILYNSGVVNICELEVNEESRFDKA